jgi:hypothetical protein
LKHLWRRYSRIRIGEAKELQDEVKGSKVSADLDKIGRLLEEFRFDAVFDRLRRIAADQG